MIFFYNEEKVFSNAEIKMGTIEMCVRLLFV